MEINKKATRKTIVNPEGSTVLKRRSEIQLYLAGSALKLKHNDFYTSAEDKLKDFLALAKEVDVDFELGLAKFLADKGLKLSPVILLSILSNKGFSFRDKNVEYVFNTPARIAEAISLQDQKLVKLNNSFKKHTLKSALENMNEFTLRKNKMRRRKVKLADLIKLLRPRPKDKKMEALYKAIIENRKEASLRPEENIVSIKSSTVLKEDEKKELIDINLEKMPINQIIRNLKFLADKYDFNKNVELQKRVIAKLNSVKDYRMLNIFDVIMAAMFVPQFEKALFEVVKRFVETTKKEFAFQEDATVLFDISGSMSSGGFFGLNRGNDNKDGKGLGFMYLILFALLMKNIKLKTFSNNLIKSDEKLLMGVIKKVQQGSFGDAYTDFNKHFEKNSSGTALVDSAMELCDGDKELKNLIVITDEVSWEKQNLTGSIAELSKKLSDKKLTIINPVVSNGTVFDKNVVAISALNPAVITDMAIFLDEKGFIEYIKKYKTQEKTS